MKLTNLIPMLNVSNLKDSLAFYDKALGFQVVSDPAAVDDWKWATIRSGDTELMLSESGGCPALSRKVNPHESVDWPAIYYFYPDDVEQLYRHVREAGYSPTPLETTFYGMKEFSLQDPDGHVLSFGQDAETS